ncbi:unnamed protein product [Clonostachys chloroleuca]|uniref:Acetolactate synthase n=1 Tax=Clonostachys chloroleuca TaxID=1926264 RepID=A0AA35MA97_9HYPO|nr:unnamed protein product [Clonostachys chloroleuca]
MLRRGATIRRASMLRALSSNQLRYANSLAPCQKTYESDPGTSLGASIDTKGTVTLATSGARKPSWEIARAKRESEYDDSLVGLKGGQIFHEMMKRHGVKHIFGYPGGAILPVFDAIYQSSHFDFVLPKHEQGAGHMAQGYARATGKPGVVLVTSGPGVTNMVTPMQDALSDGTPIVVFCGQVPTRAIGTDAFQESDAVGICGACSKWAVTVNEIDELPQRITEAFDVATSGRPGPVLVSLPSDIMVSMLQRPVSTRSMLPSRRHVQSYTRVADNQSKELERTLNRVARLVNRARKPVIYAGQGTIISENGPDLLKELANKCSIPVTTSLQGLGAFDELDDKSLHMLGLHGTAYANMAVQKADLILALGARFDDRVTMNVSKFAPAAFTAGKEGRGGIVHFEILPKNINKVVNATEAVEGDVSTNLRLLLPLLRAVDPLDESRKDWLSTIQEWKSTWPISDFDRTSRPELIKPQVVVERLSHLVEKRRGDVFITTGVGQHQMWAAQHFRWRKPRSMITSGGLGTMGFGLPAAIGAKVAHPNALVIDIDGDASFSMTLTELSTAAQFNVGVKILLLNNDEQGMVTQLQNAYYEDRYAHAHHENPDFVKVAESMHVKARRVSDPRELDESLAWLLETRGPALLEVVTDRKIPVLPTVPSGRGLDEFTPYSQEKENQRRLLIRRRTQGLHG